MKKLYATLFLAFLGILTFAQDSTIQGKIVEATTGEPIIGAIVRIDGSTTGAVTDLGGTFTLSGVTSSNPSITISYVGYKPITIPVSMSSGMGNVGTISLELESVAIAGVEILADIAITRKTPVAVTNISGEYIAERTGNQELTTVLATAPSVYASQTSGGYGDSRLTVRGFNDANVVVMVNGVPVNDMENQSLYWSNWTGLADVASKVQIQRGLGATLLSVPSVGGTVNIISKATDREAGGWVSASLGNDLYRKVGAQLSTGDLGNGFAMTVAGSRTTGDGYVDGNYIDAYSYFGSITKDFNKHSLILSGFGAPQRHGQGFNRTLSTFVAPDGSDYESFIQDKKAHDYNSSGALRDNSTRSANSIRYNSGWGYTSYDVNNGFTQENVFNQYSNFYHKPQVSLSHIWDVSDRLDLTTAVYGSWGRGGGASSWGNLSPFGYQKSDANGFGGPIDWDQLIQDNGANNTDGIGGEAGGNPYYFFRASMNHHNYYGVISKGIIDLSDEIALTVGVDGRTYSADHVRKAIDMFGLSGYDAADFDYSPIGNIVYPNNSNFGYDKESLFNRDNTGKVKWLGGFSELEYSTDKLTAALGGSFSNKSYEKIQRILSSAGESDTYNFLGGAVKAGANYNINDALNVYANGGYLSIQPIFDNVFQGGNNGGVDAGSVFEDAANEKIISVELGTGLRLNKFAANLNLYRTNWQDKALTVSDQDSNTGESIFGNAFGIDALHQGIELDLRAQPHKNLDLTGNVSLGDWQWKNNTTYELFNQAGGLESSGDIYLEDVKVGNAPQTQFNLGATYTTPIGLGFYARYNRNMDNYASFDVDDRTSSSLIGVNSNELPDFGLTDAGVSYKVKVNEQNDLLLGFNLNNVFDELYINEARENIGSPLEDLRGNFGLGRTWNANAKVNFRLKKPVVVPNIPDIAPAPVVLDRDGDGVIDAADDCPDTPGTVKGCPDMDGDGVIDNDDECPREPGIAANNGCPEEIGTETIVEEKIVEVPVGDRDGDGVVDSSDNCPDVAGPVTNSGCPVTIVTRPSTTVIDGINFIAKSVYFNTNSDVLKNESKVKLDEIASIMRQYPSTHFVVEGHTDSVGDAGYNMDLSKRRAASVVRYLIGKRVVSSALSSAGYGEERPVATNDTKEGRQQNRRVVVKLGN